MSSLAKLASLGMLGGTGLLVWGHTQLKNFRVHDLTLPLLPPGTFEHHTESYATWLPEELRSVGKHRKVRTLAKEFRILHISDLHMQPNDYDKVDFVRSLADYAPHLIVNTGDNLGDARSIPLVLRALTPFFDTPGLFVFGTNDYFAPRPVNPLGYLVGKKRKVSRSTLPWKNMRAAFVEHGWIDLNNAAVDLQLENIRLSAVGVDDPHHNLDRYRDIGARPHPHSNLRIALTHSPEPRVLRRFAADGYTLTLAGHTHGGQICLPGGRAIVTNCGIDRKRARGLHDFRGMALYVSQGLGTSKYAPVRIFCPPTATILRLVERPE